MKRFFDLISSSVLLLFLSPLLILVGLLVRLKLGRPVLFIQIRPGLKEKPFRLIKFRTMTTETDERGEILSDEKRLKNFGRFLRSTSLDELPELWNILKGEMSLVGPRPLLMEYLPRYNDRQKKRHTVRPGLTGWAQINGRNSTGWGERLEMDVWYVENRSMTLDFKILLLTIGKVLRRDGISSENHVTQEEFMGIEERHPRKKYDKTD